MTLHESPETKLARQVRVMAQGSRAYNRGEAIGNCPHKLGSTEWVLWRKGFNQALAKAPQPNDKLVRIF